MGTGGATALLSPESDAGLAHRYFAARHADADALETASAAADALQFDFERTRFSIRNPQSKIRNLFWFSDIYIQEVKVDV
jgi:hypothetical protein